MRAMVGILAIVSSSPVWAGYGFCAPSPAMPPLPCPVVWGCPCPAADGGITAPCDYNPGHIVECIDGQGHCTSVGQLLAYDCQPLDRPCDQPDDPCTSAQTELPLDGWSVDSSGFPHWPVNPLQPTCTKNPKPNTKCERQQYCNPQVQCCPSVGDPISVKDDNTVQRVEDVRVSTTLGPLTFERYFTRSHYAYAWMQLPSTVKPFGSSPLTDYSMHWTHNWHSVVRPFSDLDGTAGYAVLDTNGMISRFSSCSPLPCYAAPMKASLAHDMLYVEASRFTLLRGNAGRFVYEARVGDRTYLSRWEDPQYAATGESPRVRAALSYANPPECPLLSASGVPYLTEVMAADGTRLLISWAAGSSGCFIKSVGVGKGASTQTAVQYSLTQTTSRMTLVATYGADGGTGTETYDFIPDAGWWVKKNGIQVARHPYSGTLSDFGQGDVEMFRKGASQQASCTVSGCDASVTYNWAEYVPALGQTSRLPRSLSMTLEETSRSTQPLFTSSTENCDSPECVGTVVRTIGYDDTTSEPLVRSASNARGGFSVNTYAPGPVLPTGQLRTELVTSVSGAINSAGASPLLSSQYAYNYGSAGQTPRGWEQYVTQESRPSLLSAGQQARSITRRDASTNRISAELKTGWTMEFSPGSATWSTVAKTVATFYFTQRKCTDQVADPLGRVLEVHGPCFVADVNATDCPSGTVFPVTQFGYYGSSAPNSLNANRLEFERRWVSVNGASCTGVQLTTTYGDYDILGNPGSVTDANGVTTTMTYDEGRLRTRTVNGQTTSYDWDNGKLASVRQPEGNYDVYCYRQAPLGSACSRALPLTPQLQWQAKAPNANGTGYTEGLAYFYLPDGRLAREEAWDGIRGELRRQRSFAENARGQNTATMYGIGQGAFGLLHRFDADGNLTGYNSAVRNNSCSAQASPGSTGSSLCANLRLDRIGRIQSMDVPGATPGKTGRTCIAYDGQGNVASVQQGCPTDSSFYPGPDCATCTQPASAYVADDFGNVVSMTLPHLGSDVSGGNIRVSFNAMGLPLYRQTPEMQASSGFHAFTYDGLGRLLTATNGRIGGSPSTEALYSLAYDNSATLDSSCPQPARTLGRLLRRTDSFGQTWFQYSPEGRLLGEIRVRSGGACSDVLPRNVPHTFYTYTPNGDLSTIQYPWGRTVTYAYGAASGVTTGRVSSVSVTKWDGARWANWQALQSVMFEPFGDLRAYQLNADTSALSVEYVRGVAFSSGTGYCPMTASGANDLTGRLNLVQVSTGALSLGAGTGDIFQRYIAYDARKVSNERTCWPKSPTPEDAAPSYFPGDQALVSYGAYDVRGNRTSMRPGTASPYEDKYLYSDAGVTDRLIEWQRTSGTSSVYYRYDRDGRTTSVRLPADSSAQPAAEEVWTPASTAAQGSGGLDSVYKSVSVSGAVYSYYYDGENRRRLKLYPTGVSDEYFYSQDNQLLVDRGSAAVASPSYLTTDEYVWLGSRPVVVIRGRLGATDDTRAADTTSSCGRNGESQACGAYFIITDYLPKPVVLLDSNGKHSRKLKWDVFGNLNHTLARGAMSAHPYAANQSSTILTIAPIATSMSLSYRLKFDGVDTEGTATAPVDAVDILRNGQRLQTIGGYHLGRVTSSWVVQDGGTDSVNFRSGLRNCPPTGCLADGGLPDGGNWPYAGVDLVAYEVAEREVGAKPFDISLRFPGQYYDAETQKHENWNRYYDPSTGRYLSPEPLAQSPSYIASMAQQGMAVPTYAYALNNPLTYVDPDGLASTKEQYCRENPEACRSMPLPDFCTANPGVCNNPPKPDENEKPVCGDPEALNRKSDCIASCRSGRQAIEAFCRTVRTPERRAVCWAAAYSGEAACIGMCWAIYK